MKATLRRNGKTMVNLRLDFTLDQDEMANLLALHAITYGDVGEELSEKKVLEIVKKQLTYQGLDVLEFGSEDLTDEAFEWAKEQVSKYWKEA